jgi:hypothetical protein
MINAILANSLSQTIIFSLNLEIKISHEDYSL